jgi:transposase-like protein
MGQDGHTVETLLRWVRQHERDSGQRDGMPSD